MLLTAILAHKFFPLFSIVTIFSMLCLPIDSVLVKSLGWWMFAPFLSCVPNEAFFNFCSGEWCDQPKFDYKKNENGGTRGIRVRIVIIYLFKKIVPLTVCDRPVSCSVHVKWPSSFSNHLYKNLHCLIQFSIYIVLGNLVHWVLSDFKEKKMPQRRTWQTADGKVCIRARRLIRLALNSGFCSMKQLGILLLPPGWNAGTSQGYHPAL